MTEEKINARSINKSTADHLWNIANRLSTTCPAASRFYLYNLERKLIDIPDLLKQGSQRNYHYCKYCGNVWSPGNHRVRVQPPSPANGHIKKLLKWEREQPWKLKGHQKRKLKKYREATSKITYTCFECHKKSIFPGIQKFKRSRTSSAPSSAPLLKIKHKKGNLNAGLLIPASLQKKETQKKKNLEKDETHAMPSNTPVSTSSPTKNINTGIDNFTKSNTPFSFKKRKTIETPNKMPTISPYTKKLDETTSNKKKKKTLLGDILHEERKVKTKKKSLSDFLISL